MAVAYVSIGNTDDKLSQKMWSEFCRQVRGLLAAYGQFQGEWFSSPDAPWQNACWCVELENKTQDSAALYAGLTELKKRFNQDSIAWLCGETVMI